MEDFAGTTDPPKQGYFLGLLNSVENTWTSVRNWETETSPADNDISERNNPESSFENEVLSLPNLRVYIDDDIDVDNEGESQPPVIHLVDQKTEECSEQYEQNDDNIFSAFNTVDCSEVTSQSSGIIEKVDAEPMEQSLRDYCYDKSVEMFQPNVGMTFDSLNEAYQFYNSYSWVKGFSISHGDSYTSKKCQVNARIGLPTFGEFYLISIM
uniref:Uncharacterized protein n=1 Tax=Avena sativa TaxID=4498 RepID=A0ACD5UMK0_AVESA